MRASILIVEDDADINAIMSARLSRAGFTCIQAFSGTEAELLLDARNFDLIVTDLMLPGATGESIVGVVRARQAATPILVTSARTSPSDKVALLKLGADDYLTKPFDLDEFEARIEALLRRTGGGRSAGKACAASDAEGPTAANGVPMGGATLSFGRWRIDREARTFSVDGQEVPLTRTEFNVIELLATYPRKVFTKAELYEFAWGEPFSVEENTLNAHISNIRTKLKPSGTDGYIKTVWGLGFKLDQGAS